MSSLPLSPDFHPAYTAQDNFWEGLDLQAIEPLEFATLSPTLFPQEDERVTDLE